MLWIRCNALIYPSVSSSNVKKTVAAIVTPSAFSFKGFLKVLLLYLVSLSSCLACSDVFEGNLLFQHPPLPGWVGRKISVSSVPWDACVMSCLCPKWSSRIVWGYPKDPCLWSIEKKIGKRTFSVFSFWDGWKGNMHLFLLCCAEILGK